MTEIKEWLYNEFKEIRKEAKQDREKILEEISGVRKDMSSSMSKINKRVFTLEKKTYLIMSIGSTLVTLIVGYLKTNFFK